MLAWQATNLCILHLRQKWHKPHPLASFGKGLTSTSYPAFIGI
jgi:hypothetical protein